MWGDEALSCVCRVTPRGSSDCTDQIKSRQRLWETKQNGCSLIFFFCCPLTNVCLILILNPQTCETLAGDATLLTFGGKRHLASKRPLLPEVRVRSVLSSARTAFTVCDEICNINHYYLSCDLDVDIEIEEQIYHCLIWVTMHAA